MTIFVFGNQDLEFDSLPLRILPELGRRFLKIIFEIKDPNEEFEVPDNLTIIDTVAGIDKVRIFNDLKYFASHSHVSLHDFDLFSHLCYLQKLGKLKTVRIIGVPMDADEKEALEEIARLLASQF